jgi:hypothetical protein
VAGKPAINDKLIIDCVQILQPPDRLCAKCYLPKHLNWGKGYGSEDLVWGFGFFSHSLVNHPVRHEEKEEMDSSLHVMTHFDSGTHRVLSEVTSLGLQMDFFALQVKCCDS